MRSAILLPLLLASPAFAQTNSSDLKPISCDEETDCLAKLRGKVSRKGDALIIKLDNGKAKKIVDAPEPAEVCKDSGDAYACDGISYRLASYRPAQNFYVVGWYTAEKEGVLFVSGKTGEEIDFSDKPRFSPSGSLFVMPGAEYDDQLSIWSLKAGEAKQELVYTYVTEWGSEGFDFVAWDGETRIRLKVSPAETYQKEVDMDAVLTEQGWVLNWPFPN
jgi:hypothetical protein